MHLLSDWEMLHARMYQLGKLLRTHSLLRMRLYEYALTWALVSCSCGNTLLLLLLLCLLLCICVCLQLCMRLLLCKLLRQLLGRLLCTWLNWRLYCLVTKSSPWNSSCACKR